MKEKKAHREDTSEKLNHSKYISSTSIRQKRAILANKFYNAKVPKFKRRRKLSTRIVEANYESH